METTYLNTFLMVCQTGSMAEAARRLSLTPAAIAQQMRVLERSLGANLLRRAGRTVVPTEAGLRLEERSRCVLRDLEGLKEWVNEVSPVKELRIGTINTALHSLLPDVLANFSAEHTAVKLFIQAGMTKPLYDAVQSNDLDAAICLHPAFSLPKTVAWELLREERMVVLAPLSLARCDPHELLRSQPLIRYDRSLGGGKQADQYLSKVGIVPEARFELGSLIAIAMMVERGLGVSLVPDIAVPLSAHFKIAKLKLPVDMEFRRFGVLWQKTSPRARLIQSLVTYAKRAAQESA